MLRATPRARPLTYNITVENPKGICKGVKRMTVDGKATAGNTIPLAKEGSTVEVTVTLG